MTNQWFRSWHGAPTDPKWLGIARKAGVAPGIVAALVWALLDRASQASERGSIAGYDADGLAYFMGCEPEQVESVIAILHEKDVLADNAFTGWDKHQPKREDNSSSERVRAFRERNRTHQDTDETQCNAVKRTETLDTDTDTDTDTDKKISVRAPRARSEGEDPPGFNEFWNAYPKRDGSPDRKGAIKAFKAALQRVSLDVIVEGAEQFTVAMRARGKFGTEYVPQARTWLNGDRWNDRYEPSRALDDRQAENLAILAKYRA